MRKGKTKQFQAPKGTRDILPEEQKYWTKIRQLVQNLSQAYGFERIDTPIIEATDLFIKGTGQTTDIVEKQMYNLRTKGGDALTLRPEGTPGLIRAYLEHGLVSQPHPVKLYYLGPFFRYEQPQAGRYRQFHQWGLEVIGDKDPVADAQIIHCFFIFLKDLGLKRCHIQINSIGCPQCRPVYRRLLVDYYRHKKNRLCADCRRRLKENPLRLLDCQQAKCQPWIEGAPQTLDHLCPNCHNHFKAVLEFLDELDLPYFLNPHLVRGLDYYTKTVFEIWPEELKEQRQAALGAGGRYDNLVELLGGRSTPAVGAAIGLERVVALMKNQGVKIATKVPHRVFLVQLGDLAKKKSLRLLEELQKAGLGVTGLLSRDSIKAQLKIADKLGVKFSLILGQKEVLDGTIIIRDMSSGVQEIVPLEKMVKELKKRLKK